MKSGQVQSAANRRANPFWMLLLLLAGCAPLRLPAIDPSGQRIFLPSPASTSFESCLPRPAFSTPPDPLPCPQTSTVPADPFRGRVIPAGATAAAGHGGRNRLQLTPSHLVATVNSEVVLVTGFCGGDGYFLTKQPIEWILAQGGVGHFVDIGKATHEYLAAVLQEKPKKLSANYATGMTSTKEFRITRGTPSPYDDVRVAKGQTWISLTSPVEGTSHVSVIAPQAENWDQRRQTATIHWIDVQWQFPSPAVARAGETQQLTTTLSRVTNGSPVAAWIVRYELPEGVPAVLESDSIVDRTDRSVDISTDANGQATVVVRPDSDQPGSYPISIQIIRPPVASGDLPRTLLGQGSANITWSAPGLAVKVTGPTSASIGNPLPLRIEVSNYGDMPARGVSVTGNLPANCKFVRGPQNARVVGDRIEFEIGDLAGQSVRAAELLLEPQRAGEIEFCVRAQSVENLLAENCLDRIRILEPALEVNLTGPDSAMVGSEIQFQVEITNRSDQPLNNVRLVDRFDAGLAHIRQAGQTIDRVIPVIGAGETLPIELTFRVREAGTLCHTLQVTADGGHSRTVKACVQAEMPAGGIPANAKLQVRITGPDRARVGEKVRFQVKVTNVSSQALNNARVKLEFDDSLDPKESTQGVMRDGVSLVWEYPTLFPNDTKVMDVACLCITPAESAVNRVLATANPNLRMEDQMSLRIEGQDAGNRPAEREPDRDPVVEGLKVSAGPLKTRIRSGDATDLIIVVTNNRDIADRDVVVSLRFPEAIKVEDVVGGFPPNANWPATDKQTLIFPTLAELGPAAANSKRIAVKIRTTVPGEYKFTITARSLRSPVPVSADCQIVVSE